MRTSEPRNPQSRAREFGSEQIRVMAQRAREFIHQEGAVDMPSDDPEVRNGTMIKAEKDMPEIGVKKGHCFPIIFDGSYVRGGGIDGPSWSVPGMIQEIREKKWWVIVDQLDEWAVQDEAN